MRNKSPGLIFFMLAISLFFCLGIVYGQGIDKSSEFIFGWIPTVIGFADESGEFVGIDGACMVDEDLEILSERYPGILNEVYEFETEPETEDSPLDKTEYKTL